MSIRVKIILILFACIIIPAVVFSALVYSTARRSLHDVRIAQLNDIAVLKKERIETFFNAWSTDIGAVQHNPDIRRYLPVLIDRGKGGHDASYEEAFGEIEEQVRALLVDYGYLSVMLTDARANIVYASPGGPDARSRKFPAGVDFFQQARTGVYFSDVYRRAPGDGRIAIIGAAPVHDGQGAFVGEIVIEHDMKHIHRFIADSMGLGMTGEVVISRRDGDAVQFLSPLKHDPDAALVKRIPFTEEWAHPSQMAVRGETGSGIAMDYAGNEVLAAWQHIPFLRWGLVTKIDAAEAFAPVVRLRNQIILLALAVLVLGILVSIATAKGVSGPILDLQQGTAVIGRGNLDHKVGTAAKDEVGQLSRLIDSMTDNLKMVMASRDELNAEVVVRQQAERSLVEQSRVLEAYFKHSLSPLVFLDREFNFLRVNEAYARVCARDVRDFYGHNHFIDYPSDELKQKFEDVVATGLPYYAYSRPFVFPDHPEWGTSYWDLVVDPIRDDDGNVDFLVFSLNDVSARQESERRKEVTNDILKLFTKNAGRREYLDAVIERVRTWSGCGHAGIRITGRNGSIPFESFAGYDPSFIGQESCISLGKDDCICTRIISDSPEPTDRSFLTKSGSFVSNDTGRFLDDLDKEERQRYRATCMRKGYASLAVIPIRYRDAVVGALHVADEQRDKLPLRNIEFLEQIAAISGEAVYRFDIEEELRRNYEALQASETRYRTLVEDVRDIIFTVSPDGTFASLSPAFHALTGLSEGDWLGKHFTTLVHPDDVPSAVEVFKAILAGRPVPLFELRASALVGDNRHFEFKVAQGRTADGMVLGTARDVTERKRADEERARLASAVESAVETVMITDPSTGVILYVNPAFEQLTGYAKEEALGRTLHFLESGKQDKKFFAGLRETLGKTGVWSGRLTSRKKNGSFYFEECTVSPVRNRNGDIINYVHIRRDVTERLRLESIAESVSMMDSIGSVFTGVRHEIGNPVNSINMILGVLRAKFDALPPEAVKDYLGRMEEQVSRIEYILRSLKSFNLYESQEPQDLPLRPFMDNFLPLIRQDLAAKGIAMEVSVEAGIVASADPRALQQVLLNIVTNAADAMTRRKDPKIHIHIDRANDRVRIRVRDNGAGIPEERMKDIFKPFYTTKPRGTGLGLVIVKKMLTRMHGSIDLASVQGEGTTVELLIPEVSA